MKVCHFEGKKILIFMTEFSLCVYAHKRQLKINRKLISFSLIFYKKTKFNNNLRILKKLFRMKFRKFPFLLKKLLFLVVYIFQCVRNVISTHHSY